MIPGPHWHLARDPAAHRPQESRPRPSRPASAEPGAATACQYGVPKFKEHRIGLVQVPHLQGGRSILGNNGTHYYPLDPLLPIIHLVIMGNNGSIIYVIMDPLLQ